MGWGIIGSLPFDFLKQKSGLELFVTLWPEFQHFPTFAHDNRVQGIRLNSAMMEAAEINDGFRTAVNNSEVPCWFDVKGMQMRIKEVVCGDKDGDDHLEFILNRPVNVPTPCEVLFKAGEDSGVCVEIKDGGRHFVFANGKNSPYYEVRAGESIHIRHNQLQVGGPVFLDYEKDKIRKVQQLCGGINGFQNWFLSYAYDDHQVDEFREIIGREAEIGLKIENETGLKWMRKRKSRTGTFLVMARGDMYVEVERPHQIMKATKAVIEADSNAMVGSRMLLSCIHQSVPRCADLSDLAWLHDIGYRRFLLCDELCLKGDLLGTAVNVFDAFRDEYHVAK